MITELVMQWTLNFAVVCSSEIETVAQQNFRPSTRQTKK